MRQSPSSEADNSFGELISIISLKSEVLLPCSQESATGHPEQAGSSLHPHAIRSVLILSSPLPFRFSD